MALRALFLNTTLKYGDEKSNTEALADEVFDIYRENGVETESVRITDYNVPFGISDDLGGGDEFPQILKKVEAADIVIIGTPIWLGEKTVWQSCSSSGCTAVRRLRMIKASRFSTTKSAAWS